MKKALIIGETIFVLFFIAANSFPQIPDSVAISEIMFRPSESNSEYIELYNYSSNQVIDLNNFEFYYGTSSRDLIISAEDSTLLFPGQFAVVLEGDYNFENGVYNYLIPEAALICKLNNNSFGSTGMANTSDRQIWLANSDSDTLLTFIYTADNPDGFSDEQINPGPDNSTINWGNSIKFNGTPGDRNSITPFEFDLMPAALWHNEEFPFKDSQITIYSKILNAGTSLFPQFDVYFFEDKNLDSMGTEEEIIGTQTFYNFAAGDSLFVDIRFTPSHTGINQIICVVNSAYDQKPENDSLNFSFQVYTPPPEFNDIVINEFMFAPADDEPEWIELFNRSSASFSLSNWRIGDKTSLVQIDTAITILPGEFFIFADDSTILDYYNLPNYFFITNLPALNNSGDEIRFIDAYGNTVDSLEYFDSWNFENGKSLERINPNNSSVDSSNWSPSKNRGTPGIINSTAIRNFDLAITKFQNKADFILYDQSAWFDVQIKNAGLNDAENYSINFFLDKNKDSLFTEDEIIDTKYFISLAVSDSNNFTFTTMEYEANWNLYAAVINFNQDENFLNDSAQVMQNVVRLNEIPGDLGINEIMYAPSRDEGEWIEIFNCSKKTINLKNYQIADFNDTVKTIFIDFFISPDEYFVFAKDSLFPNFYPQIDKFILSDFPTLNNSGDKILLMDSLSRVIDSVEFASSWGGTTGKSLERISTENSSSDSTNWAAAILDSGGTAGYINSVSKKNYDVKLSRIIFNPELPLIGDTVTISAIVKNTGKESAGFTLKLFQDTDLDSFKDIQIEETPVYSLSSGDSVNIFFNYKIYSIKELMAFDITAVFTNDEDISDNSIYSTIAAGAAESSILINEFMYDPANGEPEWIELFNNSKNEIDISNWKISDVLSSPSQKLITENKTVFAPGEFLVITKDSIIIDYHSIIPCKILVSNFPNLNNTEDGIVLKDINGNTIDSVFYGTNFSSAKGFSLERFSIKRSSADTLNWKQSIDIEQSTPGRINSNLEKQFDLAIYDLVIDPTQPTINEEISISAKIQNFGISTAWNFSIEFLTAEEQNKGNILSVESLESLDSLIITADEKINIGDSVSILCRIIFPADEDTLNNSIERTFFSGYNYGDILINEIMYEPIEDQPEWIEFINYSDRDINIKNWRAGDLSLQKLITSENTIIHPGEFFIVSRDSILFKNCKTFISRFGTLGNSEDAILIYDFREALIDSFYYNSGLGGNAGVTLERVSLSEETNNYYNWFSCIDSSGCSPGFINSVSSLSEIPDKSFIINEIMYEPNINSAEFIELVNTTEKTLGLGGCRIFIDNEFFNLSDSKFSIAPGGYFLIISDSSLIYDFPELKNFTGKQIVNKSDLTLTNTGKIILIKDIYGNVIDSLIYNPDWHNKNLNITKGKSLERINPVISSTEESNWSSCVADKGATPGFKNSIFTSGLSTESGVTISPNPFSPDNDGFEDNTVISYKLTQKIAQIRVKIFDSKGRLVRELYNNKPSGAEGSFVYDGMNDSGNPLRIGIYILFIEAMNSANGVVDIIKKPFVIARKL